MCGRYSFVASREKVKKQFPQVKIEGELQGSYNIAPTQEAYVITNQEPHTLQRFRWGLVPHWANDASNMDKLINARGEEMNTRPSFRLSVRRQRCIVLADSFYEWRKDGQARLPYRILKRDFSLLAMAGLWDVWQNGNQQLQTFSIITVAPNAEMANIHNRMPLLLHDASLQQKWLKDLELAEITSMVETAPDGLLQMYRISEAVNSPSNDYADLHNEVKTQPTLF